jgi:ribosomal protein S2
MSSVKKVFIKNQLLKSNLLNHQKYSFFLKKTNVNFSFYNYKQIYQQLSLLVHILKQVKLQGGTIAFVGLLKKDYIHYKYFNRVLKNLVIKKGHVYIESKINGLLYNRWSLYKRRSNPSNFFLNLQKNNKLPWILVSFSKESNNALFREFSKFGVPIFYLIEGSNHFEFKDYPIMGTHSDSMLNFYLNILKYCLK